MEDVLGIDIGGTGIKGAPVDVERGVLTAERVVVPTPHPATPDDVARTVGEVVARFDTLGTVGAAFPAVIRQGRARTAANIDERWIGENVATWLGKSGDRPFVVINDADAAGLAEMRFGAGAGREGVVVMVTLGTGIGSAVFVDGALMPNTELGHLELHGGDAERYAAELVREREELSWEEWGRRVGEYVRQVDALLSPDLVIVGGGVSAESDRFFPFFETTVEVVPAQLHNDAGIVGAALATSSSPFRK